jgi:hypothetical protein
MRRSSEQESVGVGREILDQRGRSWPKPAVRTTILVLISCLSRRVCTGRFVCKRVAKIWKGRRVGSCVRAPRPDKTRHTLGRHRAPLYCRPRPTLRLSVCPPRRRRRTATRCSSGELASAAARAAAAGAALGPRLPRSGRALPTCLPERVPLITRGRGHPNPSKPAPRRYRLPIYYI